MDENGGIELNEQHETNGFDIFPVTDGKHGGILPKQLLPRQNS